MNIATPVSTFAASVDRDALVTALTAVARVTEKRNSIPILSNVLIQVSPGQICLTTTDLDLTSVRPFYADVTVAGRLTVPVHAFLKLAKGLPAGAVKMTDNDGFLLVEGGRKSFSLVTLTAADFPADPQGTTVCQFDLSARVLREMLERTEFAISTEETRYYLNGVFLHVSGDNKELRAVATDGHRMAHVAIALPEAMEKWGENHNGNRGTLIPRKTVGELLALTKAEASNVTVQYITGPNVTRVHFVSDDWALSSKIIHGTFPDYNRVIPAAHSGNPVSFIVEEMLDGLDGVTAISVDRTRCVKLDVSAEAIQLSVRNPELGSATETIDAHYATPEGGDAAPVSIGFNASYFREILKHIGGDRATVEIRDSASPVRITDPAESSITTALYVLMPLRV